MNLGSGSNNPAKPPQRAFPKPRDLFRECENPWVARRAIDGDPGDGLHICSCGHENKLILWEGEHPLGNVSCARCNKVPHILSRLSSVMIPIAENILRYATVPSTSDSEGNEAQYGSFCRSCGLTHRAVILSADSSVNDLTVLTLDFGGSACNCGNRRDDSWGRFHIGSPRSYHRDPIGVYQEMSIRNAEERATGKMTRRYPKITTLNYTPLGAMGTTLQHKQQGLFHRNVVKLKKTRYYWRDLFKRWSPY
jgi:hypothetical protein